jgi:VCBS repeat protein
VPNAGGSNVLLLTGTGGGAFAAPLSLGTDTSPMEASIIDVNLDGFLDLLTPNEGSNSLSVLMGGIKGSLGTPTTPTGVVPIGAATADFNHDGEPDLVVVSRDDNTVKVYLGDGEGDLTVAQNLTAGIAPGAVAAADFNVDGWDDFAVANQGVAGDQSNDTVSVFFNNGAGGFSAGPTLVAGDLPLDIKAADFNGDGRPDIVVANSRSDKISFFYSQLFNTFSNVKSIRVGTPQRTLATGDYSGDGIIDVAVGLMGQNSFVVLLGTSSGAFQTGPTYVLQGTGILDQLTGSDLNGDLNPDLVAITQPTDPLQPGLLTALIGNGEGGIFQVPYPPQATGVRPEAIAVLDLDGDGIQDVVVANRYENDVLTYHGDGTGQFIPGDRFGTGNDPFYLVPADFNDDGRPDVVAVNSGGNSVAMLLNNNLPLDQAEDFGLTDATRMAWSQVPGADSYRLYRDLMSNLAPDSFGQCFATNIGTTEFFDGSVPPVNGIYFYLLAVVTAGHEGPLGFGSTCQKRPNFHPCSVL